MCGVGHVGRECKFCGGKGTKLFSKCTFCGGAGVENFENIDQTTKVGELTDSLLCAAMLPRPPKIKAGDDHSSQVDQGRLLEESRLVEDEKINKDGVKLCVNAFLKLPMFTSLPMAYRVVLTPVMEHLSVCAVTMSRQDFKAKSKEVFQAIAQAIIPIDIDGSMTETFHRFARNFWLLGCACSVPA